MTPDKEAAIRAAAEKHSDLTDKLIALGAQQVSNDANERREARVQYAMLQAKVNEAALEVQAAINS